VNNGLGFQLTSNGIVIPNRSYIGNFVIVGVLLVIWLGLVMYDEFGKGTSSAALEYGEKGVDGDPKLVARV
jgi:hypothetical protein